MKAYERLLRYVRVASASDEKSETSPSASAEWDMAHLLKKEMEDMGLSDIYLDEHCYLYAAIPSTLGCDAPVLGLIAHMDVSSASPCENVNPRIVIAYGGGDIVLNESEGVVMRAEEFPVLGRYIGKDLIVTDGTTLLGADDKAGIAAIMTMAEILTSDPSIKHGRVAIAFTPDEEIGRGTEYFDLKRFGADYAYTVDGGGFGEISRENFNASAAKVTFTGRSVHPGTAKGIMINAQLLAMEYFALLPAERPENTQDREGFILLEESGGTIESAYQNYILRDHDSARLKEREAQMMRAARQMNEKYGAERVKVEIKQSYRNMAEVIDKYPFMVKAAESAVKAAGGEPYIVPIRGGTDGANLSFMGLPCPNLGTASHNHHGRMEFACVQDIEKNAQMLVSLAGEYARLGTAASVA